MFLKEKEKESIDQIEESELQDSQIEVDQDVS